MKFAFFIGCKIPYFVPQYESSSRAVLGELGVELADIEFGCCGFPFRHLSFESYVLAGARNLALAQKNGLDLLTPCKCCFGTLKKVEDLLRENQSLRNEVNVLLAEEGLALNGPVRTRHLLSVLFHEVGLEAIQKRVTRPFAGLKVAVHYGCHALRPSQVTRFDDPAAPSIFDQLVSLTGAQSVDWALKLDCCGNPLWDKNKALSWDLAARKLASAKEAEADFLGVACTYCQIQFDTVQKAMLENRLGIAPLPSILYPQLLGLSLGLSAEVLGLEQNELDLGGVLAYLAPEAAEEAAPEEEQAAGP